MTGRERAAADLVAANRILVAHGIVDAFGHVSVRDPDDPSRFYIARNLAPAQVTPADVMAVALDGTVLDGDTRKPYLERFIHGSVFRARPDAGAVVHSHAPAVIPFGVTRGVPLRPLFHMSSFLGGAVPVFEIRDVAGDDNDMLVRNDEQGRALADALGDSAVVLMRGHGATIVGSDVRHAVFRAIYTAQNAQLQMEALRLGGEVVYLNQHEARNSTATNAGQIERAWNVWRNMVGDDGLEPPTPSV